MNNRRFSTEFLYEHTHQGLDIILRYCPDAQGCERSPSKKFKFRPDEKTASASLYLKDGYYRVVDFGDQSYSPVDLCMYFTGFGFLEALKYLYAEFNIGETETFIKSNTTFSDTDLPIGAFEVTEADDYPHLDAVGRFLDPKICLQYNFIAVQEYWFVFKNEKTGRNTKCLIQATEHFPIFAYKFCDEWAKIYQPFDKKHKHSYLGKKPKRHVFGLTRLEAIYREEIEHLDQLMKDVGPESLEYIKLLEKKENFKLEAVFVCSGGSDGLNVASLGHHAIWFNSESEQLSYAEWERLKKICHRIYNLPDIDKPGRKYGLEVAKEFWNMLSVWLPESIKENGGKDFRDWLKRYSKSDKGAIQFHFNNLVSGALRIKFFDKSVGKRSGIATYKLRPEFLHYFLNAYGFYTFKIVQTYIDKAAPESVIFIRIDGNKVSKVSAREIRQFTRSFLRDKGAAVELSDTVSVSTLFSENNLLALPSTDLDFSNFSSESQTFFFKNNIAKVTADGIELIPNGKFNNFVWTDKVIGHNILKESDFFKIEDKGGQLDLHLLRSDCEFLNYLCNTSRISWRKEIEEAHPDAEARKTYLEANRFNLAGNGLSDDEIQKQKQHLLNKLFAVGYMLHRYKQASFAKMVFLTDDKPKELEDEANGGTGKSLWEVGIKKLAQGRLHRDGKNMNFQTDKHILHGLTADNDYLYIEDAHAYFDFGFVYNWTTGSMQVNPKNAAPYEIDFADSPKILLSSNYGIRNMTSSTMRRVFPVMFSDYYHAKTDAYHEERKVSHDFASDLFENWPADKWNRHYSFLLQCCRLYLQYRFEDHLFTAPAGNFTHNNLQASIGDTFVSWADGFFVPTYANGGDVIEGTLNEYVLRKEMYNSYKEAAGKSAKGANLFKKALQDYCKIKGWTLNPKHLQGSDGTIKKPHQDERGKRQVLEHFFVQAEDVAIISENPEDEHPIPQQTEMSFAGTPAPKNQEDDSDVPF